MDADSTERRRILIVAEDRQIACDLRAALVRLGHQVSGPCMSGSAALSLAERRKPDAALVDLRLKGAPGGADLAAQLRERLDIPVILIAGQGDSDSVESTPDNLLRHPHSDAELSDKIERALDRQPAEFALPPVETEPAGRAPALAKATELSRQPAFRELLGPRGSFSLPASDPAGPSFFDEMSEDEPELELAEEEAFSPLDAIGDPILVMDANWTITAANSQALVNFGGASPLIGRSFWAAYPAETRDRYEPEFLRAAESGEGRCHFEFEDSAHQRWLDVSAYRLPAAGSESAGVIALFRDITHRKRSEAETVRLQRLEGLGL
ncbi:MAG: PAS domain-containing protein, partial [Verrucomicrobiae bacterium]|nr:PAS domain-containing protein [Verrucomicrobiae bacterium]